LDGMTVIDINFLKSGPFQRSSLSSGRNKFRVFFKRRMEYGLEYYEGNLVNMIDTVHNLWLTYGNADEVKIDKQVEDLKPNGFQAWCNEWFSKQNSVEVDSDIAYLSYVNMMKNEFMTDDYAEKDVFLLYLNHLIKT
jgi:hypothetical protein